MFFPSPVDCIDWDWLSAFKKIAFCLNFEFCKKIFNPHNWLTFSPQKMATLRNKRRMAAVARETQAEHPGSVQSLDLSVPKLNAE